MVTINISKNALFVVLGLGILLAGVFMVNAVWTVPSSGVWHEGSGVKVNISGTDMGLQEAINGGNLTTRFSLLSSCNVISGKGSTVGDCGNGVAMSWTSLDASAKVTWTSIHKMTFTGVGDNQNWQVLCCLG